MDMYGNLLSLPDIQSSHDRRGLCIEAVGIKDVRYPLSVSSGGRTTPTVALLTMTVALPATAKGTHMSRFVEILEVQKAALDLEGFRAIVPAMLSRLDAQRGSS